MTQLVSVLSDNGPTLLLGILAYLAVEIRSDVRKMSAQVAVMWNWYSQNVGPATAPADAYKPARRR